ncbi:MAG: DUF3617 family protein [Aliidongia sp.]
MNLKLLPALVLLVPMLASAEDVQYPPRRAGLWEGSTKLGETTIQSKMCVDPASDHKLMEVGLDSVKQMGGTMSVTVDGPVVHFKTSATISGHTISSEEIMTMAGDTALSGTGHTTVDPPFPEFEKAFPGTTQMEAHWVGPCPPDMKPGDVSSNGRKFNALK